ncbi:MAG TPA: carboxyl transferase domain-containing protein [Casimicrobiaceae bacterium]|nr:carboxyl transferase domain-containing protein [Casimicrobiaceae bacterium]
MDTPRTIAPRERLAALADDARFAEHDAVAPSPHLARFGIAAQDDDGVVAATLAIDGRVFEVIAQDARFLRGSAGERHAAKIAAAVGRARAQGRPLLLLAASGGVRLHEANAAELALARALRALCDARAAGLATFAIGIGDVFGGMSVVAAACGALALTPHARFGVSGPRVIAQARGRDEVDPEDHAAVDALFGAAARARDGIATLVADDPAAMRAWLRAQAGVAAPFADELARAQAQLARDAPGGVSGVAIDGTRAMLPAFVGEVDAARVIATDLALLALPRTVGTLVIVEDSRGHEASAGAERVALSRFLAHHALVLAALRARGVAIVGVVTGVGHSAAFFANALQADRLYALPASRIVAMEAQALARVIGMDARLLARAVEDDPLLGHPARHFAALGGLALVDTVGDAR